MDPIPKSGLYYPNKIARIALIALEDVMGENGLNALLNLANLSHLINQRVPDPDKPGQIKIIDNHPHNNLDRQFDFADFSSINGALEEMYGPRGGRSLALRAGRATFAEGLRNFGALAGAGDLAFKVLPLTAKIQIGIPAMAKIFSTTSDQLSTVEDKGDHFNYVIHRCPVCWGRHVDRPACFMAVGLLQEGLKWVSGGREFKVLQITAQSAGDENCQFQIVKDPIG